MSWSHINDHDLDRYFAGELSDEQCVLFETHIGACYACAQRVHSSTEISARLQELTPYSHGIAFRRDQFLEALSSVQGIRPEWRERVSNWCHHASTFGGGAAHVKRAGKGRARVDVIRSSGGVPPLLTVHASTAARGEQMTGTESRLFTVDFDAESGETVVSLKGWPANAAPPLLLIVPVSGTAPLIVELQLQGDSGPAGESGVDRIVNLIARLPSEATGEFMLQWEPVEAPFKLHD